MTVAKQIDEVTGLSTLVVIDPKRAARRKQGLRSLGQLYDANGEESACGSDLSVTITFRVGAIITVADD